VTPGIGKGQREKFSEFFCLVEVRLLLLSLRSSASTRQKTLKISLLTFAQFPGSLETRIKGGF